MGFSRHENWSGLPFPSPGDLPHPRDRNHVSCISCILGRFFTPWASREGSLLSIGDTKWVGNQKLISVTCKPIWKISTCREWNHCTKFMKLFRSWVFFDGFRKQSTNCWTYIWLHLNFLIEKEIRICSWILQNNQLCICFIQIHMNIVWLYLARKEGTLSRWYKSPHCGGMSHLLRV